MRQERWVGFEKPVRVSLQHCAPGIPLQAKLSHCVLLKRHHLHRVRGAGERRQLQSLSCYSVRLGGWNEWIGTLLSRW
jgi:hypothetical protein